MSIHEQARAEAEKRYNTGSVSVGDYLTMSDAFVQGADWAATRTRDITTVTELGALPIGSVVRLGSGQVFARVGMDRTDWQAVGDGDYWHPWMILTEHPDAPARVLYTPEEDA